MLSCSSAVEILIILLWRWTLQNAIRLSKQVDEETVKWRVDPVRMNNLRMKFVEQCKLYFGVPYAKKYQEPGCKIQIC